MAEAPDRPSGSTDVTASLPAAPPPAGDAPKPYRTLSVLAVGGFTLAVVYVAVMAVGALIALYYHTPWILPAWTFVFPLGAAALCWAARTRVRNSEGALGGDRLATWGAGLSLAVGVVYAAYYAGSYFAVTSQAADVANRWMDLMKKDRLDEAFLMATPPPRPTADANLRDRLELEFDRGSPQTGGPYTQFRHGELVRLFEQGGEADQVQLLGVQRWGYERGGFQVDLTYRVSSPCMSGEVLVSVIGMDSADDSGERQWFIKAGTLGPDRPVTDEGARMMRLTTPAHAFAQDWLGKVVEWKWDDAYLDTLPPAERQRQAKEHGPQFDKGRKEFRDGAVVQADPKVFWAGPHDKDEGKDRQKKEQAAAPVRAMFGHGQSPQELALAPSMPNYRRDGDEIRFGFDLAIPLGANAVQSRLVVAADAPRDRDPGPKDWRVVSLDLISVKSSIAGSGGPGSGGPPAPALPPQPPAAPPG